MAWLHRVASVFTAGRSSSIAFATIGTAIAMLVIVPSLDVVFTVLLGRDLRAPDATRTGYATALVALATSVTVGLAGRAVADRNLGIFQEVHTRRAVDSAYWIGCSLLPVVFAVATAAVAIGAVFGLSTDHDVTQLVQVVALAAVAVIVGALMGIFCAGVGLAMPDPYMVSNIVSALVPIAAGVIVPTALYPTWLRNVCVLVPMNGVIASLSTWMSDGGLDVGRLGLDLGVALVWAFLGVASTRLAVWRLRTGLRRDPL